MSRPIAERFWQHVDKINNSRCWVWIGSKTRTGYGHFKVRGKLVATHRLAYELLVGPIPAGMNIDHVCNHRDCVNPEHLRVCTPAENAKNRAIGIDNTSGLKGASWHSRDKKWTANIHTNGKQKFLGYFETKESAHAAYCEAATRLYGEFANFGKVVL